jgi:hypothetical protein
MFMGRLGALEMGSMGLSTSYQNAVAFLAYNMSAMGLYSLISQAHGTYICFCNVKMRVKSLFLILYNASEIRELKSLWKSIFNYFFFFFFYRKRR